VVASIIIPTRNRAKELLATLQSICKQTTLANAEIIIIDNGSTDDTAQIVEDFRTQLPMVYDYNDIPGLLTGRHRGAEISKGEILCFLDDDVELNPNFIANLLATFENNQNVQLATGPCLPHYEVGPPEWLSYFWDNTSQGKYCAWLSLLDFGDQMIEIDPNFVWGLNFSIRKNVFIELGGFHPDCIPDNLQQYQGDGETGLTIKAISKGYKAFYVPGLELKHYVPAGRLTHSYFKKRAFYQGVCNSYTDIRKKHENGKERKRLFKSLRDKLHPYYRWIKKSSKKAQKLNIPPDIEQLIINLEKSGKDVRQWALKSNYWDYKLPIIW
jgi:glycosyltransferase involved in cell wall biosynthesis